MAVILYAQNIYEIFYWSRGTGYINRYTFEVAMLDPEPENYEAGGIELLADVIAERAAIEANPDNWIEIPKFDAAAEWKYGKPSSESLARFAKAFFDEHGLDVEID